MLRTDLPGRKLPLADPAADRLRIPSSFFLIFHLAHLTFGANLASFDPTSPYHDLVTGLASWPVAVGYIAAAAAVGGHLVPGVWSGMRSRARSRSGWRRSHRVLVGAR